MFNRHVSLSCCWVSLINIKHCLVSDFFLFRVGDRVSFLTLIKLLYCIWGNLKVHQWTVLFILQDWVLLMIIKTVWRREQIHFLFHQEFKWTTHTSVTTKGHMKGDFDFGQLSILLFEELWYKQQSQLKKYSWCEETKWWMKIHLTVS